MDAIAVLLPMPGILRLGTREFVILRPTPRDMIATVGRMRELARARCVSPLDYVLGHTHQPPAALAFAVQEAIKIGSGGGVEPTQEAVWEQYATLAGIQWRCWYHISRVLKDFTPADIKPLVTADTVMDAIEALDAALKFADLDPEKKTPPTGTPS